MKNILFISTLLSTLLSSCICQDKVIELDKAESLLQTRPDSCLIIMRSIDENSLDTKREKARYALLMSAALDKNYIDMTSDSLIKVAVDYYSSRDDQRRRMMSNYYHGLVLNNAGEYTSAIVALEKAEKDALDLDDHLYAGLIYRTKGSIFNKAHIFPASLECQQKAIDHFGFLENSDYEAFAKLGLAICHINNKDYSIAWRILESILEDYSNPQLRSLCEINQANILVESNESLERAVFLFKNAPENSFDYFDNFRYALALEKNGQHEFAEQRLSRAYKQCINQSDSATVAFSHAEILHLRGNDSEAYRLTRKAAFVQDSLTRVLLQQSVSNAQRDYYKAESQLQEERAKRLRERNRLGAAAALLALALLSGATLSYRKRKEQEIKEQMLNLSIAQAELRQAEQTNASLLGSLFSEKLHHLDMISEDYVRADSDKERIAALREFKEEIAAMRTDEDLFVSLEKDLDRYCDGVMSKLRTQVPSIKGDNLKLITLFFAGLPYSTVQLVMNRVSIESLKMARSRFRKEIKAANAPDEAQFIKLLEMKGNRSARQDK